MRGDFPSLTNGEGAGRLAYLDNAATTLKPSMVLEAARDFYREAGGNVHRGTHQPARRATTRYEAAREEVARFIGAKDQEEIVFTSGTTESMNFLARSFGETVVGRGDRVVVTEMEHHSNLLPWWDLCRRRGAELVLVPFDDGGALRLDLLDAALERRAKIVSVAHVSNSLGTLNPVRAIAARARRAGAAVVVDGAQAVAHLPVDVSHLDCDFYAFSGHKMYAETGIGVLYGRRDLLETMKAWKLGGGMVDWVEMPSGVRFAPPPRSLEAGTPNISGAVSLAAAMEFMRRIERDGAHERVAELVDRARRELSGIEGARVLGCGEAGRGLVSFHIEGADPYDVACILDRAGVAVGSGSHCAQPAMRRLGLNGTVRASFAAYNDMDDLRSLVGAVRLAAGMLRREVGGRIS